MHVHDCVVKAQAHAQGRIRLLVAQEHVVLELLLLGLGQRLHVVMVHLLLNIHERLLLFFHLLLLELFHCVFHTNYLVSFCCQDEALV